MNVDIEEINKMINQIDFIIPTVTKRVLKNRNKKSLIKSSEPSLKKGEEGEEDSSRKYKEGDILEIEALHILQEKHAFENNIKFSKMQATLDYNRINDRNYDWEHSLDQEHSLNEQILYEKSLPHIIELSKLFEISEDVNTGIEGQVPSMNSIHYPSDIALMMMVNMWAKKGEWSCCLGVCNSMIFREKSNVEKNRNKDEECSSDNISSSMNEIEEFEFYNKIVFSPLSVCYRHTVRTLCSNNQYDLALSLTNQMKKLGLIITPSSLAQLLLMFEINEKNREIDSYDLKNDEMNNENNNEKKDLKICLLDFQEEIIETILIASKFEKINYFYLNDKNLFNLENDNNNDNNYENRITEETIIKEDFFQYREGYSSSNQRNEIENDQSATASLISINIKLLCERGKEFCFYIFQ